MRRFFSLFLVLLFLLTLGGCANSANTYRVSYDLPAEPVNLDPQTADDPASLTVIHNILEGLFTVSALGELENAIAASYTVSTDGLIYTFTLREDAQWEGRDEDGRRMLSPVTAADFAFALRRILRPDTGSPAAAQFYCIQNARAVHEGELPEDQLGVYVLGDYRLSVRLSSPNDHFLYLLASTYAMPCNETFFTATRGKYGLSAAAVMTNGPFSLRSWKPGNSVRLIRSESYYNAENVLPGGVNLWIGGGENQAARLLEGAVHAAVIDGEEAAGLGADQFNSEPIENGVWGLYLNQKHPDLREENLRKGIAYAVNRSVYEKKLAENLKSATAIVPHGAAYYGQNYREFAGERLAQPFEPGRGYEYYQIGLSNLGKSTVTGVRLLVNRDSRTAAAAHFQEVSQILQRELSFFVSIDAVSAEEYAARLRAGNFDIALYRIEAPDNTPWSVLSQFRPGDPRNCISYENGQLNQLLEASLRETESDAVMEAYREAEQMILDDAVFIPLFYSMDYFVTRQESSGITYNPQTGLVSFQYAAKR